MPQPTVKRKRKNISVRSPFEQLLKSVRKTGCIKESVEDKINHIIQSVAAELKVDVCSCYLMRPGDVLELYASVGLNKRAIHDTFLRIGEGLIGEIALKRKPQSFANVWEHASFVYKPETEEKKYHSLAGVPILYENVLLGVLSIQTKKTFVYPPETMNLLQVVAMAMAEILYESVKNNLEQKIVSGHQPKKIEATRLIPGIAMGTAYVHKREALNAVLASDSDKEVKRLETAIQSVEEEINQLLVKPAVSSEQSAILETYLMFIRDKGWVNKMIKAVQDGLTAEAAVQKVCREIVQRMELITDTYIKERIHDLQDLANRIIRRLQHGKPVVKTKKLPRNTILVAKSLGPAELLDYDTSRIKGIVLEEGSQTMHVVIIARSYNIPVISGIKNISTLVLNGDLLALDAFSGFLYLNPSDEVQDEFEVRLKAQKRLQARLTQLSGLPAVTKDGIGVSLNLNAGLQSDIMNAREASFDGIGLYRTELPFISSERLPDTAQQTDIYKRVMLEMKDKPVVFRTLDIGSDKVLPYFENQTEKNPAMGWRSIRITLDRRAILRGQLRSFIRACAGKSLHVMFPMITSVAEFLEAKKTFELELKREKELGHSLPEEVKIGTMIEVPSLLFQLEELVKVVDFVSIGTNDLSQFLFATDRSNSLIWERYDVLSPSFLKMMRYIRDVCYQAGIPCSVCGEMASHPLESMALVGLGYTKLSMNAGALGKVKAVVRSMNQSETEEFLLRHLSDQTASLRALLRSYAIDHEIFI